MVFNGTALATANNEVGATMAITVIASSIMVMAGFAMGKRRKRQLYGADSPYAVTEDIIKVRHRVYTVTYVMFRDRLCRIRRNSITLVRY